MLLPRSIPSNECLLLSYFAPDLPFSLSSAQLFTPLKIPTLRHRRRHQIHGGRLSLPDYAITRRNRARAAAAMMLPENPLTRDVCATAATGVIALVVLGFWNQTVKYGVFDQKLNRKLVHVSVGLVFMLCWPLFSSGYHGAVLASLIPGVNIVRLLLLGLGVYKDESTVNSISRSGDYRELLKGPLYYAIAVTFACVYYWRTSPIGIAAICNLCAGDGFADIVGRRLGNEKLPYNKNKSFAGSIAMATAGFLASVGYMHYFSMFGFIEESWHMTVGFLLVSIATTMVESLPISTELDDNLTVPLTSFLVANLFL